MAKAVLALAIALVACAAVPAGAAGETQRTTVAKGSTSHMKISTPETWNSVCAR